MRLALGSPAPDFTLPSTAGRDFNLRLDALGQPLVLFFYPKDFTHTCTAEACSFRNGFEHFWGLGVTVVGVSRDSLATHLRFKAAYNLPFDLLSDVDGRVTRQYAGTLPLLGWGRRVTYLLDAEQRVAAIYSRLLEGDAHVQQMKAALARLQPTPLP